MISEMIRDWCGGQNMTISDSQLQAFERYAQLLIEWNGKMNLTAITEEREIAVKHFIDSLSLLCAEEIKQGAKIIDIGTGAGFPGVPLKIMRPDLKLTLLDSLNKRLVFLQEVCKELDIDAEIVHGRAEELGRDEKYREKYDYAVSRAVAYLPALCEYCLPFVKKGGSFIPMKGPEAENELNAAKNSIEVLGGHFDRSCSLTLPDDSERTIVVINKVSPTPRRFPRRGVKISKQPL